MNGFEDARCVCGSHSVPAILAAIRRSSRSSSVTPAGTRERKHTNLSLCRCPPVSVLHR